MDGFSRLDRRSVDILAGAQAIDANLVKGLERVDATIGRIDADVIALREALARTTPGGPLSVAIGLSDILGADRRGTQRVALPHPFTNMSRESWVGATELWLKHAPALLSQCAPRACPACASAQARPKFHSYDGYLFVECVECGAWYTPVCVNEELFRRYFEVCPEARRFGDYMLSQEEICSAAGNDRERFSAYYRELRELAPGEGARAIDLGCGVGNSIDVASELGFDAYGVEVNQAARQAAAARGRRVYAALEEVPNHTFDVITLWESLEHIDDVEAVMNFVNERLAVDGVFAATVPNLNSPSLRSLGGDSMHIHGGTAFSGHINLFSQASLTRLLERFGLEVVVARGQYSMNLHELIGYHLGVWRGARDYLSKAEVEFTLPASAVQLISVIGPIVSQWERDYAMAPILHVVARHRRA